MPDAARIAQATVLEVPVTVQGTRTLEGSDERELFTESAKTTLTLDCGAVLHLKTKVAVGQSVFLRNDQTGKEILCKVLEAPADGQAGYTDLEFTTPGEGFWGDQVEEPAATEPQPEVHEEIEAAHESLATLAMMQSSASAVPEIPAAFPEAIEPQSSPSLPETSDAGGMAAAEPGRPAEAVPEASGGAEPHDTKDAEQLAAMMTKEAKWAARRTASTKEVKQKPEMNAEAAAKPDERRSVIAGKVKAFSPLALRIRGICTLTSRGESIAKGIAATVVIAAALGFAWHAKLGSMILGGHRTSVSSAQPHPQVRPASAQPSQAPPPAVAAMATNATKPATTAPEAAVVPTSAKGVQESIVSAAPKTEGSSGADASSVAQAEPQPRKADEPSNQGIVPAKIVSQPQPIFPGWAKDLDVDGVVKLDAVIDEKGNVAETKPLSGPRALQHAAEAAVGLWMFEPAMTDGKPTATHMVLTVQFQR